MQALILRTYEAAEPKSLVLCILSAMTDAAAFIKAHEELFIAKTKNLVIYCGVAADAPDAADDSSAATPAASDCASECASDFATEDEPSPTPSPTSSTTTRPESLADSNTRRADSDDYESKFLEADKAAQAYLLDPAAANFVFYRCQELGVPLLVLGRQAAYASAVPFFIYDELAATGHPVALRLRESQRASMESLATCCSLPVGDERRQALPARCDRAWFDKMFCGGVNCTNLQVEGREIWSLVTTLYLHLVVAMLASHPAILETFFEVDVRSVRGRDGTTNHLMVGCGPVEQAVDEGRASRIVRDSTKLCAFIMNALRHALSESADHAKAFARRVPAQERHMDPTT